MNSFKYLLLFSLFLPGLALSETYYTDKDHPDASDNNNGIYREDGGTGPFETIQRLADQLAPGDTGYIRQSAQPYVERYRDPSLTFGGVTLKRSGTPSNRITLAGYPGERPVIDQGRAVDPSNDRGYIGINVYGANHITIQNIEIREITGSGILIQHPGNSYVNNIIVDDVHVHHVYGRDNTSCVVLNDCRNCILKNSILHNAYDVRGSSNDFDNEPYALADGALSYDMAETVVHNNYIHTVNEAIHQKRANPDRLKSVVGRCNIVQNSKRAFMLRISGVGDPPANNAEFYGNVLINVSLSIDAETFQTVDQSTGLKVFNNTHFGGGSFIKLWGMDNAEVYNNVFVDSKKPVLSYEPDSLPCDCDRNGTIDLTLDNTSSFAFIDNNLYYNTEGIADLDLGTSTTTGKIFNSLSSWKSAESDRAPLALSSNPGVESFLADPNIKHPADKTDIDTNSALFGKGVTGQELGAWGAVPTLCPDGIGPVGMEPLSRPKPLTVKPL